MAVVSIIMPVFNTGEILRIAVDSILHQTYKEWELLLVDDGSTDQSPKICDDYSLKDSRIKVYHKKNGGICDARNFGIRHATSEYIAFCDHDDEYLPDLLEKSIEAIIKYKPSCLKYRNYRIYDNGRTDKLPIYENNSMYFNEFGVEIAKYASLDYFGTIWTHIYLRDIIVNNQLQFDTSYKHGGEDFDFNIRYFRYVNSIVILNDVLYKHYVRNALSTSSKVYTDLYDKNLEKVNKLNALINSHKVEKECYVSYNYLFFIIQQIRFILSYGAKLSKNRKDIVINLRYLNTSCFFIGYKYYDKSIVDNIISFLFRHSFFMQLALISKCNTLIQKFERVIK